MPAKIKRNIGDIVNTNKILEEVHKNNRIYYEVECTSCKTIRLVRADNLKCQCRSCAAKNRKSNIQDNLIGRYFGNWQVIDKSKKPNYWVCKDITTGTIRDVFRGNLTQGLSKGDGTTRSWGEQQIKYWLEYYKIPYQQEFTFVDLRSDKNMPLRFDFALLKNDEILALIEYDGRQHFCYDKNWKMSLEDWKRLQHNDQLKNEYCLMHNLPLFRITETDNIEAIIKKIGNK